MNILCAFFLFFSGYMFCLVTVALMSANDDREDRNDRK